RVLYVTGVQTCALPISRPASVSDRRTKPDPESRQMGRAGRARRVSSLWVDRAARFRRPLGRFARQYRGGLGLDRPGRIRLSPVEIGRASCRERVWLWVG